MALYAEHKQIKFAVGDTIKVKQKIVEGKKERLQAFIGLVIAISGHQGEKTFTVRKISEGIGVERIFPIDSPMIDSIEIIKKGLTRRSKLYYLRSRTGRLALKVKTDFATAKNNGTNKSKNPAKVEPKTESGENRGTSSKTSSTK